MTISCLAPGAILWVWDWLKNWAYLLIFIGFIEFLPLVVVFAHFAHFGGRQSHFKPVELLVGAPRWPSEVLNILRYPNHNYKIASVPKIRFVQFLRQATGIWPWNPRHFWARIYFLSANLEAYSVPTFFNLSLQVSQVAPWPFQLVLEPS